MVAISRSLTLQTERAAREEFDAALKRQADGEPLYHGVIAATLITIFECRAHDDDLLDDEREFLAQSVFDRRGVQCHAAQDCSSGGCGRMACGTCRTLFKHAQPAYFGYKVGEFRAAQTRRKQAVTSTTKLFNITDKLDGRFGTVLLMHMTPAQLEKEL